MDHPPRIPHNPCSSSSSDEEPEEFHPYQKDHPTAAYEYTHVIDVFEGSEVTVYYVRVDMPGVPEGSIKVFKNSKRKMISFQGRAPILWSNCEASSRFYAGFVLFDKDPNEIQIRYGIVNGCFRMWFTNCGAELHFLDTKNDDQRYDHHDDDPADQVLEGVDERLRNCTTFIEHAPEDEATGIKLKGGKQVDLNPFQLSGVKGVYEDKILKLGNELYLYMRVDVPTIQQCVIKEIANRCLIFNADAVDYESHCDARLRSFVGLLVAKCNCCLYELVRHDYRDGVLRFLARKIDDRVADGTIPSSSIHFCKPPETYSIRGLVLRKD